MRNIVDSILASRGFWLLARILLAVVFVSSGLAKLLDFEGGMAEMRKAGLAPEALFNAATIALLLGGSALLLLDRALWLGVAALAVFLAAAGSSEALWPTFENFAREMQARHPGVPLAISALFTPERRRQLERLG